MDFLDIMLFQMGVEHGKLLGGKYVAIIVAVSFVVGVYYKLYVENK